MRTFSRRGVLWVGTLCSMLAEAPAFAYSPNSVRKMDSTTIQKVSDRKLCDAFAVWRSEGRSYPVIDDEVRRRGISCAEALETVVSDCSMLKIVAMDGSDPRGVIFTVANTSPKPKRFRIYSAGIQSSAFVVRAGATQSFGVAVDPRIARLGALGSTLSGDGGVELNECTTATWGF